VKRAKPSEGKSKKAKPSEGKSKKAKGKNYNFQLI
jgi:hypothetical protein